eukprot:TRINITY_DN25746_c0_g1_i1.p1 TRINITY_DN25746_c0_g1~~TRINITY_DN25746_c0_g1_i1.p1  ORF type:complete len:2511 (+),score=326.55 TRINITY_DN25746_c0_g1_i1:694-7533(+)
MTPHSVTNAFFNVPNVSATSGEFMEVVYDGSGSLASIPGTLKGFLREDIKWWTDKNFGPTNLKSDYTRATFYGGIPLPGFESWADRTAEQKELMKGYLVHVWKTLLLKADSTGSEGLPYQHMTVTWFEGKFLKEYNIRYYLFQDCLNCIGTLSTVGLLVLLQVQQPFVWVLAALGVALAFSATFYFHYVVGGYQTLSALDFVSLFLIVGIAADDVLLLVNSYAVAPAVLGEHATPQAKMKWAYKEAAAAMLVTTVTTCGSFYSNCLSIIKIVKQFGFFMGTLAAWNFINVLVIVPSAMLVNEIYIAPCFRRISCCCCNRQTAIMKYQENSSNLDPTENQAETEAQANPHRANSQGKLRTVISKAPFVKSGSGLGEIDERGLDCLERCLGRCVAPTLAELKWVLVVLSLALSGTCVYFACSGFKLSSGDLVLFEEEFNLGRLQRLQREVFPATSMDDLSKAIGFQDPNARETIVKPSCPRTSNSSFCNGNGDCDTLTGLCNCKRGYVGVACSGILREGTLDLWFSSPAPAPSNEYLHLQVLPSPTASEVPRSVGEAQAEFLLSNQGDYAVDWAVKLAGGEVSWISILPNAGIVSPRIVVAQGERQGTGGFLASIYLGGKSAGWRSSASLSVTSTTANVAEQVVQITSMVIRPPALRALYVLPGVPTNSTPRLEPDFDPLRGFGQGTRGSNAFAQANYSIFVVHEVVSIELQLAVFEAGGGDVYINGFRFSGRSDKIPVEIVPRTTTIQVDVVSPVSTAVKTSYILHAQRNHSGFPEVVRGDMTLEIYANDCIFLLSSALARTDLGAGIASAAQVPEHMVDVTISCGSRRLSSNLSISAATLSYRIEITPGSELAAVRVEANIKSESRSSMTRKLQDALASGSSKANISISVTALEAPVANPPTTTATASSTSATSSTSTLSTRTLSTQTSTTSTDSTGTSTSSTLSTETFSTTTYSTKTATTLTSSTNTSSTQTSSTRTASSATATETVSSTETHTYSTTGTLTATSVTLTATTGTGSTPSKTTGTLTVTVTSKTTATTSSATNTSVTETSVTSTSTTISSVTTTQTSMTSTSSTSASTTLTLTSITRTSSTRTSMTITGTSSTSITSSSFTSSSTSLTSTSATVTLTTVTSTSVSRTLTTTTATTTTVTTATRTGTTILGQTSTISTLTATFTTTATTLTTETMTATTETSTSSTVTTATATTTTSTGTTHTLTSSTSLTSTFTSTTETLTSSYTLTKTASTTSASTSTASTNTLTQTSMTSTSTAESVTKVVGELRLDVGQPCQSFMSNANAVGWIASAIARTAGVESSSVSVDLSCLSEATPHLVVAAYAILPGDPDHRIRRLSASVTQILGALQGLSSASLASEINTAAASDGVFLAVSVSSMKQPVPQAVVLTTITATTATATSTSTSMSGTSTSTSISGTSTTATNSTASVTSTSSSTTTTSTSSSTSISFSTTSATSVSLTHTSVTATMTFAEGVDLLVGELALNISNCTILEGAVGVAALAEGLGAAARVAPKSVRVEVVQCLSRPANAQGGHGRRMTFFEAAAVYGIYMPDADAAISQVWTDLVSISHESLTEQLKTSTAAAGLAALEVAVLGVGAPSVKKTEFCPGTPPCSGTTSGRCLRKEPSRSPHDSYSYWKCNCSETYDGADCSQRVCPTTCLNGGTCAEGDQTLKSTWGCRCPRMHTGPRCEWHVCPGNCSQAGDCDQNTGDCSCYPGYSGADCGLVPEKLVPLTNAIAIAMVWGLKGYRQDNQSAPEYDDSFGFLEAEVQAWVHDTCTLARADPQLLAREEIPCWIEAFSQVVTTMGASFPINSPVLASQALQVFFHEQKGFQQDIATDGDDYAGRVTFTRVRIKVNMGVNDDVDKRDALRKKWEAFVEDRKSAAPAMAGQMYMVSSTWTSMELESRVLSSTTMAFAGSMLTCLAAIVLFTQSGVVAVAVLIDILLVVGLLAGVLLKILEFEFGVVEAFGATMFVGMGVDYCLHLAHGYHEAPGGSSRDKIKHALIVIGPSILGGAVTTVAGVAFLVPCRMVLFRKLGWLLLLNAIFSLIYTFIFLSPFLMILGHLTSLCRHKSKVKVADVKMLEAKGTSARAKTPPPVPRALPQDWEAIWSEAAQKYYFWHQPTDKVTWEQPPLESWPEPKVVGKTSSPEVLLTNASDVSTDGGLRAAASSEDTAFSPQDSKPTLKVKAKMVKKSPPGAPSGSFPDGKKSRVDGATGTGAEASLRDAARSEHSNDTGHRPKVVANVMGKNTSSASTGVEAQDSSDYSSSSSVP